MGTARTSSPTSPPTFLQKTIESLASTLEPAYLMCRSVGVRCIVTTTHLCPFTLRGWLPEITMHRHQPLIDPAFCPHRLPLSAPRSCFAVLFARAGAFPSSPTTVPQVGKNYNTWNVTDTYAMDTHEAKTSSQATHPQ
jgi:hypothetical protein